eukprot:11910305-Alexandrium_andersonii.AAC.1
MKENSGNFHPKIVHEPLRHQDDTLSTVAELYQQEEAAQDRLFTEGEGPDSLREGDRLDRQEAEWLDAGYSSSSSRSPVESRRRSRAGGAT